MKSLITVAVLLYPVSLWASQPSNANLSEIAEQELVFPLSDSSNTASDKNPLATVLVSPVPLNESMPSYWKLGFRLQKARLSGTPEFEFIDQENLSQSVSEMNLYSLSLHRQSRSSFLKTDAWGYGVIVAAGQASSDATATSGRPVEDIRFQVLQAAFDVESRWRVWKNLAFTTHLQAGVMNFTQSSSNTSARFSSSTTFLAPSAGLSLDLGRGFLMGVMYENRSFPEKSDFVTQAHHYLLVLEKEGL